MSEIDPTTGINNASMDDLATGRIMYASTIKHFLHPPHSFKDNLRPWVHDDAPALIGSNRHGYSQAYATVVSEVLGQNLDGSLEEYVLTNLVDGEMMLRQAVYRPRKAWRRLSPPQVVGRGVVGVACLIGSMSEGQGLLKSALGTIGGYSSAKSFMELTQRPSPGNLDLVGCVPDELESLTDPLVVANMLRDEENVLIERELTGHRINNFARASGVLALGVTTFA